jgi:imidazolonepropionase-like amidohydrolase
MVRQPIGLLVAGVVGLTSGCGETMEADLIIVGATLIDGTGADPRAGSTIVVRDGRIVQVAEDGEVSGRAATRIDAAGRYAIPGLTDMHVHFSRGVPLPRLPDETAIVLKRELYYGVTTVLSMGATGASTDSIRRLREEAALGAIETPHIYGSGGHLTVHGSHPIYTIFPADVRRWVDSMAMVVPETAPIDLYDLGIGVSVVRSAEAVQASVRERAEGGMNFIKITIESGPSLFGDDHPQMSVETTSEIVRAAAEFDLPVLAHVSSLDELVTALEGGVDGAVHAVNDEPLPDETLADRLAAAGFFVIPTLSLFSQPTDFDDPFLRATVSTEEVEAVIRPEVVGRLQERWTCCEARAALLENVRMLHERGVRIGVGTDTGNPHVFAGYDVHRELELLVEAGLSPREALAAATSRPAELLRASIEFGTLEPGKRADLVLLRENPLTDIRHTRTIDVVISQGRVIDRASLAGRR